MAWVQREDADAMLAIIEAFDSIPFVWWSASGGYIFVLLPRHQLAN